MNFWRSMVFLPLQYSSNSLMPKSQRRMTGSRRMLGPMKPRNSSGEISPKPLNRVISACLPHFSLAVMRSSSVQQQQVSFFKIKEVNKSTSQFNLDLTIDDAFPISICEAYLAVNSFITLPISLIDSALISLIISSICLVNSSSLISSGK